MENIEDVSDLFFSEENTEGKSSVKKILEEKYTPKQIGSITKYIEPIGGSLPLSNIVDMFAADSELSVIPVEDVNGRVIGIISRDDVDKATDSTFKRITAKNVDNYITPYSDSITLDANDLLEMDLQKITDINRKYGIRNFLVFDGRNYARSFFGIANLHDILSRIAEIRMQDLQKAAIIQTSVFPQEDYISALPYKVTGWHRMANSLGGDIYQALRINEYESFVGLFDVSGKNVAASLITIAIASFFKITDNNSSFSNKPSTFVSMLDKYITSIVPEGTFATGVVCYFNTKQDVIYIYNCGHTTTYLLYAVDGKDTRVATLNPLLSPFGIGMVSETLSKKQENAERPFSILKYRDKMHIGIYSDGFTDMHNKYFEVFDEEGVKNFFLSLYSEQDEDVKERISQTVENFTADTLIPDDITVVDIRL